MPGSCVADSRAPPTTCWTPAVPMQRPPHGPEGRRRSGSRRRTRIWAIPSVRSPRGRSTFRRSYDWRRAATSMRASAIRASPGSVSHRCRVSARRGGRPFRGRGRPRRRCSVVTFGKGRNLTYPRTCTTYGLGSDRDRPSCPIGRASCRVRTFENHCIRVKQVLVHRAGQKLSVRSRAAVPCTSVVIIAFAHHR
jgi:hypothetical protein